MKRIVLTLPLLLCTLCFTYCQHSNTNNRTPNGFIQPEINPALYQNHTKNISLQDSDVVRKIHELDCYFEDKVKIGFNGAVLINYKGTPIFERYYGYKNFATKAPLTPHSTFQIASTSKTFTSGAILLLLQQNMLSLEDTIQKFFPNFPYKGITVRMLLNHRSGLPNYLNFSEQYWKNKKAFMTNEDVLRMMIKYKPKVLNAPDVHFRYNNTNYVLLALIVEKVSGQQFCDFLHQNIFIPLGMTDTWLYDPFGVRATATKGYKGARWLEDEIVPTDGVYGDKGIYSTVRDLYKWDQALSSGKFIRPEIIGLAYTPQSFEKAGNKNYGLGWRMQDQTDGTRLIYHNGWWHSYNSVFNRKISDNTTVIILSNHYNQGIYKIQPIWDILYGNGTISTSEDESNESTKELNSNTLQELKKR
ncbi:MAG TPA: serine hydrolase domain-containing protein [Chitinophagales bacterium]|nr:serine hydrolase domain-containing protein [Chitinophagales bacterium]